MDRRHFLALIASAPIAALAPWPHFLPTPQRLAFDRNAFRFIGERLDIKHATGFVDVVYGVGYVRAERLNADGTIQFDRITD